jgi:peptide/nickel transport system substrate-binding protein
VRHLLRAVTVLALALAAATPAAGATLTVASEDDPDSLDPALAYAPESWQVLVNAGEGLVAYRREPGAAGADVVPALADGPPRVSAGGRRLVFRLRGDARFGPPQNRPVRPSDVKASLERLFVVRSPGRGLYRGLRGARAFEERGEGGIVGIVARDGVREVEFRLSRADPSFVRVLALPFAFALPRGTPASDQGAAGIASAGPYRVAAYARGDRIDLQRNPGYVAGQAGPAEGPDRISVDLGVSVDEAVRRAAGGDVDYVMSRPNPEQVGDAAGSPAQVRRHLECSTYYFFMNTRREPFDDVRVRRAVNLAIDRRALTAPFAGQAAPTARVLPPGIPGHDDPGALPEADLPAARRLVRRAGAEGAVVSVWGLTREPSPTVTRRLASTLAAIGLRPQVRLWERRALLAALADPGAPSQIGYARWRNDYPDGADWFPLLLSGASIRPGANLNYALLDDDRVDRLIARAQATWDPALRARRWWAVERAVAALAPWAPFANGVRTDVLSSRVRGYVPHQLYGFLWMRARLG